MKKLKKEVVLYLDGEDKEKEMLLKKYCKDWGYVIVKTFKSKNSGLVDWDEGIFDLYNGIVELSCKHNIERVITYSLEDLDYGLDSQTSICNYLWQVDARVETLKEGEYMGDFWFDYKFETYLDSKDKKEMKKYWTKTDKENCK